MSDRISLRGLTVRGYHGVYAAERSAGQDFVVDAELEIDLGPAAASDDVADTVHYGELAEALAAVIAGESVQLIETLAGRLAEICLSDQRVKAATITVHKPRCPHSAYICRRVGDRRAPSYMTRAVLSLGSNMGDRLGYLQSAVDAMRQWVLAVSPVYETAAFGTEPQDPYLNAVVIASGADIEAQGWLDQAHAVEAGGNRTRERRWAPRTLDVDVIAVDDLRSDDAELTLPHPRAHERAFVLVPWLDVEPDAALPSGSLRDLLGGIDTSGVLRRDDLVLR